MVTILNNFVTILQGAKTPIDQILDVNHNLEIEVRKKRHVL
jgi:hypothetical protein